MNVDDAESIVLDGAIGEEGEEEKEEEGDDESTAKEIEAASPQQQSSLALVAVGSGALSSETRY